MDPEQAQQQFKLIAAAITTTLGSVDAPLDPCDNVYRFIQHYNLLFDGQVIDYEVAYKHLREIAEDIHPVITLMAGAQTGKSVLLMINLLRDAVIYWGQMLGYYFPDQHLPRAFSTRRFAPFVRQSPIIGPWLGKATSKGKGQDAVFTRTLGPTTMFFLTVAGRSSTEGLPMKGVYFDEVRRMQPGDIERAMERTSAQVMPRDIKVSTAFYPESDIHKYFLEGDQRWFHTIGGCNCKDGVILSRRFPDCIEDLSNATTRVLRKVERAYDKAGLPYLGMLPADIERYGQAVYRCPVCGELIVDPRDGYWVPEVESNYPHSYQMPQMLSPTYSAARVLYKHEHSEDIQEFYNSTIGIPWIDPETQPVRPEHLKACVRTGLRWWANMSEAWRRKHAHNCAMGVDVQAGYNIVVIKKLAPNGKFRTVHLEVVHGDDPWKLTARFMVEYDVRIAVVDGEPHWNEAFRFVKAFPGRAWVADETDGKVGKMVSWKDLSKNKDQRGDETRFKYGVTIHRTKGLRWSLDRWVKGLNETPHPTKLVQRLPVQKGKVRLTSGLRVGRWRPTPICRDVYWPHMQAVAFRKIYTTEEAERQGRYQYRAEHVAIDPHFAHADMFADVALARIGKPRLQG